MKLFHGQSRLGRHNKEADVSTLLLKNPPHPGTAWRRVAQRIVWGALAVSFALALSLLLIAKLLLAPQAGEWSTPWRVGPVRLELGVPALIRLATSPWFGPVLAGHTVGTRWGAVHLGWEATTRTLELRCAPCRVPVSALGTQPLQVAQLSLRVRQDFDHLTGTLEARNLGATEADAPAAPLHATWEGTLTQQSLELRFNGTAAPIAQWVAVMAPHLPELPRAQIDGTFALQGRLTLPSGRFELTPVVTGFQVRGLGTEAWASATSTCGQPSRLRNDAWLARAVIAAEDQRFQEHAVYDLRELIASLATNQTHDRVERGGSTLTQQLAKRLVASDERSAERKLRELLYAVEMERTLGKTRILQLYLDNAPWGEHLCGAEAAAQRYFNRSARSLEPAQAVWLAAMLHNPELESRHWTRSGDINRARAQWVAESVRGIPGMGQQQRNRFLKSVSTHSFRP